MVVEFPSFKNIIDLNKANTKKLSLEYLKMINKFNINEALTISIYPYLESAFDCYKSENEIFNESQNMILNDILLRDLMIKYLFITYKHNVY